MDLSERIRRARGLLRQREVADALGVSVAAVSNWERGIDKPTLNNLAHLADFLKVDLDDLVKPGDDLVLMRRKPWGGSVSRNEVAPLVNRVAAGAWTDVSSDDALAFDRVFRLEKPAVGEPLALEIESGSMRPDFKENDIIIIDPAVEPGPGDFVVAKLDNQEKATFKKYRLRAYDDNGHPIIDLVPLNPDFPTLTISAQSPGRIVGTMIEHRRFRPR